MLHVMGTVLIDVPWMPCPRVRLIVPWVDSAVDISDIVDEQVR